MMKFPKSNYELKKIFKQAKTPQILDFNGEYYVNMLTVLPSLRRFSHRKVFYHDNNRVIGYNVLFSNKIWGHFYLENGACREIDCLDAAVINYNRTENSFISKRIIDYIRCVEKDFLYLGRFNYFLMGKPRFLGYFSLEKKAK